jgi:hypothetical protein
MVMAIASLSMDQGVARLSREGVTVISALLATERSIKPLERGAPFLWSEIWPTRQRVPATGKSGRIPDVFDGSEFQPFSGGFTPENTFSS